MFRFLQLRRAFSIFVIFFALQDIFVSSTFLRNRIYARFSAYLRRLTFKIQICIEYFKLLEKPEKKRKWENFHALAVGSDNLEDKEMKGLESQLIFALKNCKNQLGD